MTTNMTIGKVEYRVRQVTRYHVTRHYEDESGTTGGTEQKGEYDSADLAHEVACALARDEHDRLGWPVDDPRMQYPRPEYLNNGVVLGRMAPDARQTNIA